MNLVAGTPLRIGDWRVDPTTWEISRGSVSVRVEARTMGLLLCLAEHAGRVVSIQQLLDQVWSGVIVSPDSVYQAIASLRRVLGDDARRPCYIETVPRLGYRLVTAVSAWVEHPVQSAVPVPAPGSAATAASRRQSHQRMPRMPHGARVVLACGTAFCLALLSAVLLRGDPVASPTGPLAAGALQQSVAVLPLLDLTPRALNEEAPGDGMTEELIEQLSRIRGLRVPPPTCPSYLKDKQLGDIARSLNVAYVLDGSVRESDSSVRVAVRLRRAYDGHVVWSETYDRPEASRLTLQNDIASQVARVLKAPLT
jgi:transcriptional activator of cad operon